MTTSITRLAMIVAAIVTMGMAENANSRPRHGTIRDHAGPNGASSGGVFVNGHRVDVKPRAGTHGSGHWRSAPVVRDRRADR